MTRVHNAVYCVMCEGGMQHHTRREYINKYLPCPYSPGSRGEVSASTILVHELEYFIFKSFLNVLIVMFWWLFLFYVKFLYSSFWSAESKTFSINYSESSIEYSQPKMPILRFLKMFTPARKCRPEQLNAEPDEEFQFADRVSLSLSSSPSFSLPSFPPPTRL